MQHEWVTEVPTGGGSEQIALLQRSDGEHLFLAWHGITAVNRLWYWDALWGAGRVVLAGLPGHGPVPRRPEAHYRAWSARHFIDTGVGLLRQLGGGRPATLIGHSTGGMIALGVALAAPELVERLILISPVVWGDLRGVVRLWTSLRRWPRLARAVVAASVGPGQRSFPLMRAAMLGVISDPRGFFGNPRTDSTLRQGQPHYAATAPAAIAATARVIGDADLRPQVLRLRPRVPALLIHGDRDGIVPLQQSVWLAQALPRAELVTVPGAGHTSWAENEPFVNEQVVSWCVRHPLPQTSQLQKVL